jgi:uncharacterized protein (TIGR02231 family)
VLSVTLFEDRAEVTRRALLDLPAGASTQRLTGLSCLVHDASLRVRVVAGGAELVAHRVRRRLESPQEDPAAVAAAEERLAETARRRAACDSALDRARAAEGRAAGLGDAFCEGLARTPLGLAVGVAAAAAEETFGAIEAALQVALDGAAASARAQVEAHREEEHARALLAALRAGSPRRTAEVELQLLAPAAGPAEVELRYLLPCAVWRPEHAIRLAPGEGPPRLAVTSFATCWQLTGEAWEEVALSFSTARPAQAGSAPDLAEDRLQTRRKTEQERATVAVELREQAIQVAGLAAGARQVDEMPGVDDGGAPLLWPAARPSTLPSSGAPARVELQTVEVPCALERVAFPELGPAVHLRARATWRGAAPLLAGPAQVGQRSAVTGRGQLSFVAPGEPFELGLGPDDGLRVRRSVDDSWESLPITSTRRLVRRIRLDLSNLSGGERTLLLVERIPVSEVEQVEVKPLELSGGELDRDGLWRKPVTLAPRERRSLELSWRLDAKASVRLPQL